jgi:hypothetical protein
VEVPDGGDAPLATVVVVPRERFSRAVPSLEVLYERTDPPFDLVYVDGGGGPGVRRALGRLVRERGHTLVRSRRWLTPNEARNLGATLVSTRYVVFVDNDVEVATGWLEALVRCAEETGADVVGPWVGLGPLGSGREHHNGGTVAIEDGPSGRRLVDDFDLSGGRHRRTSSNFEFHCVLVRTDTLRAIGPLDERLPAALEHLDLCLRLRDRGASGYLEPASTVSYVAPPPAPLSDAPYFLFRWSRASIHTSVVHFRDTWDLPADDETLARHARYLAVLRRRVLNRYRYGLSHRLGAWAMRLGDGVVDVGVSFTLVPWSSLRRRFTPPVRVTPTSHAPRRSRRTRVSRPRRDRAAPR